MGIPNTWKIHESFSTFCRVDFIMIFIDRSQPNSDLNLSLAADELLIMIIDNNLLHFNNEDLLRIPLNSAFSSAS